MGDVYAHTPGSNGEWHRLEDHLQAVARTARDFADAFDAGDLAYWLGLWHDIGKCNPAFQEYLQRCHADPNHKGRGPDHKAAGAELAQKHLPPLALLVQGHHGGITSPADWKDWFAKKTQDQATADAVARARALLTGLEPAGELAFPPHIGNDRRAAEFFLRMLFSTLVDADFLDTEAHRDGERAARRTPELADLAPLLQRLEREQMHFSGQRVDVVGQARHAMYQACLEAADRRPGWFRLAMPTGGGKTRSGMAFALKHAVRNGQRRVIVAVPFVSITEQTAKTYRDLFDGGDGETAVVLEHHSGAGSNQTESPEYEPSTQWSRLAAENWDTPVVVTTTVQLFESLFSNKTSRCRKLHRLAKSVIILDEAQALPARLLQPILDGLQQLTAHYGTTVVISTATQPAFDTIPAFTALDATDIVPDAWHWFSMLKRVEYAWRTDRALSWSEVGDLMRAEPQALAVVNTKKDALSLLDALDEPAALHLSTLLCGAHRRAVIKEVKRRLTAGEPCRLVSTQVIEAGVDLDFPLVLRAMGPLDSIIQAAGRCNREGLLARGRVIVFIPSEGSLPLGPYRTATDLTWTVVGGAHVDPDDPAIARRYFADLYATVELDRERIQLLRRDWKYQEVGLKFRMIDDDSEDVVVMYGTHDEQEKVRRLIARLQQGAPKARGLLRQLQPYLVSLPRYVAERHRKRHVITPLHPALEGLGVWHGQYDPVRGLTGDELDRALLVF